MGKAAFYPDCGFPGQCGARWNGYCSLLTATDFDKKCPFQKETLPNLPNMVIKMNTEGASNNEISQTLRLTPALVRRIIEAAGREGNSYHRKRKATAEQLQKARKMWKEGRTYAAISIELGFAEVTIRSWNRKGWI